MFVDVDCRSMSRHSNIAKTYRLLCCNYCHNSLCTNENKSHNCLLLFHMWSPNMCTILPLLYNLCLKSQTACSKHCSRLIQFQGCYDRAIVHCSWWARVLYPAWWYRGWQSIHLTVPPIYLIVPHLTVCNTSNVTKLQLWDILRPIFVYNFLTQLSQTKEKTELIDFTHSWRVLTKQFKTLKATTMLYLLILLYNRLMRNNALLKTCRSIKMCDIQVISSETFLHLNTFSSCFFLTALETKGKLIDVNCLCSKHSYWNGSVSKTWLLNYTITSSFIEDSAPHLRC